MIAESFYQTDPGEARGALGMQRLIRKLVSLHREYISTNYGARIAVNVNDCLTMDSVAYSFHVRVLSTLLKCVSRHSWRHMRIKGWIRFIVRNDEVVS